MRRALVVLLPVLLLAGCASSPDATYLSSVRQGIPALVEVPDKDLTHLGHQLCDALDTRGFDDGMAMFITESAKAGLNADNVRNISRAAVTAYCPEFSDDFS